VQTAAVLNAWSPFANFTNTSGALTFTNPANSSVKFFRLKSFP
jgi:hypothetical protein